MRALLVLLCAVSVSANAFTVYEDVGFTNTSTYELGQFSLAEGAPIEVTLTDFGFNRNFDYLGVAITSASEEFLRLELNSSPVTGSPAPGLWGVSANQPLISGVASLDDGVFKQVSGETYLESGNYYVALIATLSSSVPFWSTNGPALYGVEVIATPLPASVWMFISALAFLYRKQLASKLMTFRH